VIARFAMCEAPRVLARVVLLVALLTAPSVAFAQGTARVRVDDEALSRALASELELRGYVVTEGEADGAVWTETTPDARRWGRARRMGTEAARVELTEGEDPRVTAVVLAALFDEQMQMPVRVPPPPPVVPFPWALMFYGGFEIGPHLLLGDPWEGGLTIRASLGMQWREGLRIGIVAMPTGHARNVAPPEVGSAVLLAGAGLQIGARTLDPLFAVHYGIEAIVTTGRQVSAELHSSFAVVLATYAGIGVWANRRTEVSARAYLELWLDEVDTPRPHASLAARIEWR
jgi:hypothetical protein